MRREESRASDASDSVHYEHDVFISYAREDVETARQIAEALKEKGWTVWWDDALRCGKAWDIEIERALERSRAVVVLWSKHSVKSDWVRAEAEFARTNGRLISVKLEGVQLPIVFRIVQTSEIASWFGKGVDVDRLSDVLSTLSQQLGKPDSQVQRIVFDWLRAARPVWRVVLFGVLLAFLLYGTGLADQFGMDTKLRYMSVAARNLVLPKADFSSLTVVKLGPETLEAAKKEPKEKPQEDFSRYGPHYRRLHEQLILGLAKYKPRVIALDMLFRKDKCDEQDPPASTHKEAELAKAIECARQAGVSIVLTECRRGNTLPKVKEALENSVSDTRTGRGYLTDPCFVTQGGWAPAMHLRVRSRNDNTKLGMGFAAAAYEAFNYDSKQEGTFADEYAEGVRLLRPSEYKLLRSAKTSDCPYVAQETDFVETLIVDMPLGPRYRTTPPAVEYYDLLTKLRAHDEQTHQFLVDRVKGKLVFVGLQLGEDEHDLRGWEGGKIWGSELQAHALETLFARRVVRVQSDLGHMAMLMSFGFAGVFVRMRFRRDSRKRRRALAALLAASLALVLGAAVFFDLLIDGVYHLVAIVLSYYYARRFFPELSAHVGR